MHTRPHIPRVSVIIPTKDEAKNLEALLPDMPDVYEVVRVDAGAQGGTLITCPIFRSSTRPAPARAMP